MTGPPARGTSGPQARGQTGPVVVLVAGTGTEIGKTWVGAALATELRTRGLRVAARKPAQSFEPGDDAAGRTDAQVLGAATGEDPAVVCPRARWFDRPLAPPMAAAELWRSPFTIDDLVGELSWPAGTGAVLVETAGGVRSPLAEDGDAVDLARRLAPDRVVLVADAGLGTINAVRLSADALTGHPLTVFLNRFDPADRLHLLNQDWLGERVGLPVTTTVTGLADAIISAGSPTLQ